MDEKFTIFMSMNTSDQIHYLKEGEFCDLNRDNQVRFLKYILKPDLSSKTTACALKILRELRYQDRFFFRKFLFHVDSSVANAAKKGMAQTIIKKRESSPKILKLVERERSENRVALIKSIFSEKKKLSEHVLLSLLASKEVKVRQAVKKEIVLLEKLNEAKLAASFNHSIWYVRAQLVEILGYRRSRHLFDLIEQAIEDSNTEVRLRLVEALSRMDRDQARDYLKILAQDHNVFVRKEAERVLRTI